MPVTLNQTATPVANANPPGGIPATVVAGPGNTVIQPSAPDPIRIAGQSPVNSKGADYKILHHRVGMFTMGDLVNVAKDLVGADIPWLLEQGAIAAIEQGAIAGVETIVADLTGKTPAKS